MNCGFIGAGNMATAIIGGILKANVFPAASITVSNRSSEKLDPLKALGIHVTTNNAEVVHQSDFIILAVKPQMLEEVISPLADQFAGKCVVSIAAGISVAWLKERLKGAYIVRVMPNTPLQLGLGATAVAAAPEVPVDYFQRVLTVFQSAGETAVIDEAFMDDVIPVNGSSPAFFFRFADAMTRWAEEQGMDGELALKLAATTMKGSAQMLLDSGKTAGELTRQVCSPGGTTLAALTAFDDMDFDKLVFEAMTRCANRSRELGK
jgi:pyrroline-5-carboxylate reductase